MSQTEMQPAPVGSLAANGVIFACPVQRFSWSTRITNFEARIMRNLESTMGNIEPLIRQCQPTLQSCWATNWQVSTGTWLSLLAALIVGVFGLRYTYQAMKLAEWTARKDFLELCRETQVQKKFTSEMKRTFLTVSC